MEAPERPETCQYPGCEAAPMVGFQTASEKLMWLCNDHFAVALARVAEWLEHLISARWN